MNIKNKIINIALELYCQISRKIVSDSHRRMMEFEWGKPPKWQGAKKLEFFNHHLDLFYAWLQTRNCLGWERGIFSALCLKGGATLDLCCGDGFYSRNFYSLRSKTVCACDFEKTAISYAKKYNFADNISYQLVDIRKNLPHGMFDNIIWDAAIEHFTLQEIEQILLRVKNQLSPSGILSGYTIVENIDGCKQLSHHEHEFSSKNELLQVLAPFFKNTIVFETIYPNRHNLYFWASDSELPLQNGSDMFVSCKK
jgi:2-polyprenyl-3-methyl-5-hydroxy-6-metoxy-1,4-benzoquinol methylase